MAYDSFLSILSIVLIPVFIWWIRQPVSSRIKFMGLYIILFFAQGSMELLGFNQTVVRYLFELPLIVYFVYDIARRGFKRTPGWLCVVLFVLFSIPSVVFTSVMMYLLFLQQFMLVWIAFYVFYNSRWNDKEYDRVNRLFVWLCVSQIFAAILKFSIVGICEPYIGTMSSHSGGLTTLFSLTGFCYCMIMSLCMKRKILLLGCLGFVLFGLIGEKRALVFMIPAFLLVSYFVYSLFVRQPAVLFIKRMLAGAILIPVIFYVMVRVNPSFNPDRKVWGKFDLEYTIDYAEKYNSGTLTNDSDGVGRSEAHARFHEHIFNDNLYNIIFGYGAGLLVQSSFNHEADGGVQSYSLDRWGIGYNISIGYITILAQVGIAGTLFYYLIYLSLLRGLFRGIVYSRSRKSLILSGYGISAFVCILAMLFLSLIYNTSAFTFSPVTLALMWFISYAYKQVYTGYDEIYNRAF